MYHYYGFNLDVPSNVYHPSDDSHLLMENIVPKGRILEVGTGSGILAIALAKRGHDVVATDINPQALIAVRRNAAANGVDGRVSVVRADLLNGIKGPFDTVVFNPPYLQSRPLGELRGLGELGAPGLLDRLAQGPACGQLAAHTPNRIPDDIPDDVKQGHEEPQEPDDFESRAWMGGKGGSEVLDKFMGELTRCLAAGGKGYIVVSSLTDFKMPEDSGLDFRVIAEQGLSFERLFVLEIFRRPEGTR